MPEHGITESLEWLTDIIPCRNGEQRISTRTRPRQEFTFNYKPTDAQLARARELAKSIGGEQIYLPVWTEFSRVGSIGAHTENLAIDTTVASYAENGYALVWQDDETWEVVEIATVADDEVTFTPWIVNAYSDAFVMPVRVVTLPQEPDVTHGGYGDLSMSARFEAVDAEYLFDEADPTGYGVYLSYPVVLSAPELVSGSVRDQYGRELDVIDSGTGLVSRLPLRQHAFQTSTVSWCALDKTTQRNLRVWLHKRRGRQKAFWLPSFNHDVVVVKEISPGDTFIQIAAVGFAAVYSLPVDVVVLTKVGGYVAIRVTAVTTDGPTGTERLQFAGAFGGGIALANIAQTCKLTLCRFDSDRIELQHAVGGDTTVAVPVIEVPA